MKVVTKTVVIAIIIIALTGAVLYFDDLPVAQETKLPSEPHESTPEGWWWNSRYIYLHGASDGDFKITYLKTLKSNVGLHKTITWLKIGTSLTKCQVQLFGFNTYIQPKDLNFILWKFNPNKPPIYWDLVSWDKPSSITVEWSPITGKVWFMENNHLTFDGPGIYKITVSMKFQVNGDIWNCWGNRGLLPFDVQSTFESNDIKIGNTGSVSMPLSPSIPIHLPHGYNPYNIPVELYPKFAPISGNTPT